MTRKINKIVCHGVRNVWCKVGRSPLFVDNKKILKLFILYTLILLFGLDNARGDETWDCLLQESMEILKNIEIDGEMTEEAIIVSLILNNTYENIQKAEKYLLERRYNRVMMSLYLNSKIQYNIIDNNLLRCLIKYSEFEHHNAFPFYLLSCYYARKKNLIKV